MKKMKSVVCVLLCLVMAFTLAACTNSGNNSGKTQIEGQPDVNKTGTTVIQIGHANPGKDDDFYNKFCMLMSDHLYDLSKGKYSFEIFADCLLGGERDMYEGLQMGTLDAALVTTTAIEAFVPAYTFTNLPFLFESLDDVYKVFDDADIMTTLNDGCYETGVKVLGYGENGFRKILNFQKSINSLSDIKGMKIRCPESATYLKCFTALGANPTAMAFTELYTGLQQHTIDGLELPIASIYTKGFYDVAKYLSATDHMNVAYAVCLSKSFWEGLSAEEQGWFQKACDLSVPELRAFVDAHEGGFLQDMISKGVTFNEVADKQVFIDACRALYPDFKDTIGAATYDKVMKKLNIAQ